MLDLFLMQVHLLVLLNTQLLLCRFLVLRKHFSRQSRLRKTHLNMVSSIKHPLSDKQLPNLRVKFLVLLLLNAHSASDVMLSVSLKMPKLVLNLSNTLKKDSNSSIKMNKVDLLLSLKRKLLHTLNLLDHTILEQILLLNSRKVKPWEEVLKNPLRRRKLRLLELFIPFHYIFFSLQLVS